MHQHKIVRNPAGHALKYMNEGNLPRAEEQARQAVEVDSRDHEAVSMLAYILHQQGRHVEAQPLIERAMALAPRNHYYLAIAGQIWLYSGDLRKAALCYERAQRLNHEDSSAVVGRAEVMFREKKLDRALALLEGYVKRGKEDNAVAAAFGRICRELKQFDRGIEVVSRHLNDPNLDHLSRSSLYFTLGQLLEGRGDYRPAMESYITGNQLTPSMYDPQQTLAQHQQLREVFTRQFVAIAPKPVPPSSVPVFIIGMPRSGTTLTEQIIHAHPQAFGGGELCHLLPQTFQNLSLKIGSTLPVPQSARDLDRSDVEALSAEYLSAVQALAGPDKTRIVDKCLGNDVTVGLIATLFPGAHIIHLKRDPIDNCIACFSRQFSRNHPGFTRSLETLGFHYRAHMALMEHWKQELEIPILTVQYEELVADQERISRQIIDFIGLPWDEQCLAFYKERRQVRTMSMHQVDKPIYTSSVGRAERFGDLLDPLRKALAGA